MDESIEAECDEEIARISSQARGPGRSTNDRGPVGGDSGHGVSGRHDPPRPMSWDGELSDNELIDEDVGEIRHVDEDVEFSSPKPTSAFEIIATTKNTNHLIKNNSNNNGSSFGPGPQNLDLTSHQSSSSTCINNTPLNKESCGAQQPSQQPSSHSFYITPSSGSSQQSLSSRGQQNVQSGTPGMQIQQMQVKAQSCTSISNASTTTTNNSTITANKYPGNPPLPSTLPPNKQNHHQNGTNCSVINNTNNVNVNNANATTVNNVSDHCIISSVPNHNNNTNNNNNNSLIANNNNLHRSNSSSSNSTIHHHSNNHHHHHPNNNHHQLQHLNNNNTQNHSSSANNTGVNNNSSSALVNNSVVSNNPGNVGAVNLGQQTPSISNANVSIPGGPSGNAQSGTMILQQHNQQPPMNLSFPRIPPSPDSALGGWSTPSSNLSRHNSDASQRSFSSSSNNTTPPSPSNSPLLSHNRVVNKVEDFDGDQQEVLLSSNLTSQGISRQQLINSPCPICGDRISGFHYGIFSCESCKGFFKRTVQNRKNYVCLRGASCHVAIATRKKCPACRFDKCLRVGMKLEAIREDRTRGGRSTYACSYTLPPTTTASHSENLPQNAPPTWEIPELLKEIVECESLWHLSADGDQESDLTKGSTNGANSNNPDYLQELCAAADRRLYRLVKWCKSLPLFKNIQVDDQTKLLLNSWCELLLFSCCYRSIPMPAGSIRINERLTLKESDAHGNQCITRMIHFTENLRRLKLDTVEYAALKVIILMSSEVDELQEGQRVRESQERLLQCLQTYTLARCPESPSKFGELLLKIPELQRICQVGKEMLTAKTEDSNGFNLLFELLRGDH